ncbi:proline and serine-rich protein 1 [Acipenser ruthenus]|uniref:proline and serine-rich protein 1 n=1 Tax=Acipenser ruthenus TaxID=7906 RepID=UPI002740E659|nr:proline and serine-rich protein 1 [Acipenser ruthenus]
MDKKSFEIVLDEIRKCVLTEQRTKAIEHVHGYFSSEQVTELLKYFSWADPQIKAVKALQHKMVAVPTTKVANILNCFTFSKDKLVALELIALNISDAHNYRPIEDLFRFHLPEKKRCRRILEQASKVGCKAPVAMISSCGMIPGNPYPQGKPSLINGIFPGTPAKKEGDDNNNEGKGIAARILGPYKPAPSTYNPHKPVPYPIPPCRPHATIAPSAYSNGTLVSMGGVIASNVPPPPYQANQTGAAFSRPSSQQSHSSSNSGPTFSPHGPNLSAPATPVPMPAPSPAKQPAPFVPITPVFPGLVPTAAHSPSATTPIPSVIKGPPLAASPVITPNHSGHSTPIPQGLPGVPPSVTPTPSVIKSHTPSVTPCATPVPNGSYTPVPSAYPSMSRSGSSSPLVPTACTLQGQLPPGMQGIASHSPSGTPGSLGLANPTFKGVPALDIQSQLGSSTQPSFTGLPSSASPVQHGPPTPVQSVIRSYTPSTTPTSQGSSTPGLPVFTGLPPATTPMATPKPSAIHTQSYMGNPLGAASELHMAGASAIPALARHSNSPVTSAFKGPSRSATPSLSSLVMPNTAALVRSLGLSHSAASAQATLSNTAAMAGLQGLSVLSTQGAVNLASHTAAGNVFSGLPAFSSLSSGYPGAPGLQATISGCHPNVLSSSASSVASSAASSAAAVYTGLPPSVTHSGSPFGLGFPGLPPGSLGSGNSGFPGFVGSSTPAGSPVLSHFVGLQGPPSSVAAVPPLQAAVAAAAAAAAGTSSAPVLPGFASAFSSNFNPALVAQAGMTPGLQPAGNAAFPGLLSFPGIHGFSQSPSPASLSGLQHSAVQSALLQAHSASALESYPAQTNGFANYPTAPGTPFALQPGLHPQLGWQ